MSGTRVQGVYNDNGSAADQTVFTVNGSSASPLATITAANLVILELIYQTSATGYTATFKDQSGNALPFSLVQAETTDASSEIRQQIYVLQNAPSGITGITITLSASAHFCIAALIEEWSGLATTGAVDGKNSKAGTATTATDNLTSNAATNANQPAIVWGATVNCSRASIPNAGTGYTSSTSYSVQMTGRSEYKRVTAAGSNTATFTNTGTSGDTFLTQIVVLDESRPPAALAGAASDTTTASGWLYATFQEWNVGSVGDTQRRIITSPAVLGTTVFPDGVAVQPYGTPTNIFPLNVGTGGNLTINDCGTLADASVENQIFTIAAADITPGVVIPIPPRTCIVGITVSSVPDGGEFGFAWESGYAAN